MLCLTTRHAFLSLHPAYQLLIFVLVTELLCLHGEKTSPLSEIPVPKARSREASWLVSSPFSARFQPVFHVNTLTILYVKFA